MTTPIDHEPKTTGAPKGNTNAIRHGLRCSTLPPGCKYIEGQVSAFRRYVRSLLLESHGEVTVYHEAVLQSAIRHEQRALLASRWLRIEGPNLELSERLQLTAAIANASDNRDKCLQRLELDKSAQDDAWPTVPPASLEKPLTRPNTSASSNKQTVINAPQRAPEKPMADSDDNGRHPE